MLKNFQSIGAFLSAQNRYGSKSIGFSHLGPNYDGPNFQETKIEQEIVKYFEKIEKLKKMP